MMLSPTYSSAFSHICAYDHSYRLRIASNVTYLSLYDVLIGAVRLLKRFMTMSYRFWVRVLMERARSLLAALASVATILLPPPVMVLIVRSGKGKLWVRALSDGGTRGYISGAVRWSLADENHLITQTDHKTSTQVATQEVSVLTCNLFNGARTPTSHIWNLC